MEGHFGNKNSYSSEIQMKTFPKFVLQKRFENHLTDDFKYEKYRFGGNKSKWLQNQMKSNDSFENTCMMVLSIR